jgi:hypothetical protein
MAFKSYNKLAISYYNTRDWKDFWILYSDFEFVNWLNIQWALSNIFSLN